MAPINPTSGRGTNSRWSVSGCRGRPPTAESPRTPACVDQHTIPEPPMASPTPSKAVWPADRIPVEIFEIVTSHLSRHEVRNLRLVCREFEAKVSAQYFRNVVVPFRSELYSGLSRDDHGAIKRTSSALFSNGMRIFESFGRHILRFALSLELDESILAYPPIKPSQEAVPAFWGIYRWPHSTYHRYTDLEGLEQTADETDAMKEALKCLVKVTDLGLCCDAGLGFLAGPDHIARNSTVRHPVFGTRRWRRHAPEDQRAQPVVNMTDSHEAQAFKKPVFENPMSFKRTVLQKMVQDAGYTGDDTNEAVRLILETEGTSLGAIDFDERRSMMNEFETRRNIAQNGLADFEGVAESSNHPLIPSSLTRAQKEMLLELEWAHRAMIQSYVIGLIDNALEGNFSNLTTLTIAKIPSSHVYIFNRHELWQTLPSLTHVSLGIIADWRRISKPAPGCVEDTPVSPVEAVSKAFSLLNDYIGVTKNIESLHFEWICGGEFAPGTFQRNHFVLPAPFFQQPELMVASDSPRKNTDQLLRLPYVKHLSLKNCWASPHVFLQTLRRMALSSLEKLELETVSLSGPPTTTHQAPLQQQVGGHQFLPAMNLLNLIQITPVPPANGATGVPQQHYQVVLQPHGPAVGNPALVPSIPGMAQQTLQNAPMELLAPGASPAASRQALQQPDWLSWAGLIEHFSPSVKIRDLLASQQDNMDEDTDFGEDQQISPLNKYIPDTNKLRHDENNYKLKSLSFKSCGYVSVDATFLKTRSILPHGAQGLGGNGNPHHQDFSSLMQRCRDKLLGRIALYMRDREMFQLITAFGMDIGWATVYDKKTITDAASDGVDGPGRGRFSGTLDASSTAELIREFHTGTGSMTLTNGVNINGPIHFNDLAHLNTIFNHPNAAGHPNPIIAFTQTHPPHPPTDDDVVPDFDNHGHGQVHPLDMDQMDHMLHTMLGPNQTMPNIHGSDQPQYVFN